MAMKKKIDIQNVMDPILQQEKVQDVMEKRYLISADKEGRLIVMEFNIFFILNKLENVMKIKKFLYIYIYPVKRYYYIIVKIIQNNKAIYIKWLVQNSYSIFSCFI